MNLVFASGFSFPQRLGTIDYFDGVEAHLEGRHETVFPPVPPFGSSKDRARQLADKIHERFPQGAIHIIAHSMGGLDSRYLIDANHNGLSEPGRIASLTTLSTPHRGSPVAGLLSGGRPGFFSFLRRGLYDAVSGTIGALGFSAGALQDLTEAGASKVPDVAKTHPHIRYRSYAATGRTSGRATSLLLWPTHEYIKAEIGQPNDGLVALESAKYGEFQTSTWPCDHVDVVGHDLDFGATSFQFDHLARIDDIIGKL